MTDERWIQFNEGLYEISNKGNLRNIKTNKLLKYRIVNNKIVLEINLRVFK